MSRLMLFRSWLLILCLSLLFVSTAVQKEIRGYTVVNYKVLPDQEMLINVKLQERLFARLILDTDTTYSTINNSLAAKLGVQEKTWFPDRGKPILMDGKPLQQLTTPCFGIGHLQSGGVTFGVAPPEVFERFLGSQIDGLLGLDLLSKYALLVDPMRKQITFWSQGKITKPLLETVDMADATVITLTLAPYACYVRVRFNDQQDDYLTLDTGAAYTAIPVRVVHKLKLKPMLKGYAQSTLFGNQSIGYITLKSLTLGNITIPNLPVQYSEQADTKGYTPHIGRDILSHCRFLLDFPENKLYLKPDAWLLSPDKHGSISLKKQ